MTETRRRTPVVLVTGLDRTAVGRAAGSVVEDHPGTVLVDHDVRAVAQGVVVRSVRTPEHLCWAIEHVPLDEVPRSGTAGDSVGVEAVLAVVGPRRWLGEATGEDDLLDRGLAATADDER